MEKSIDGIFVCAGEAGTVCNGRRTTVICALLGRREMMGDDVYFR